MVLKKLNSLGSYEEINGGAHRKAASIVGIPAIVRHLGFWHVDRAEGDSSEDVSPPVIHLTRPEAHDDYIAKLTKHLKSLEGHSVLTDKDEWFVRLSDRVETGSVCIFRFAWHGLRTTVRLEYHSEYITLTSIIDASVMPELPSDAAEPPLLSRFRTIYGHLKSTFDAGQVPRKEALETASFLQHEVWRLFEDQILDAKVEAETVGEAETLLGARLGEVFVDLRGVLTGSRAEQDGAEQTMATPFQQTLPRQRLRVVEHGTAHISWSVDALKRIWHLIESDEYLRNYEFSVSAVLGGHATFATALGFQSPKENHRWPWKPVCYFVHAYTDDEWQLGRLIDRINTLGTLRLAATMQFGSLKEIGGQVEALASQIEQAMAEVRKAIKEAEAGSQAQAQAKAKAKAAVKAGPEADGAAEAGGGTPSCSDLERCELKIDGIRDSLAELRTVFQGDARHRLERSSYYFDKFSSEVKALRLKRIEGYQLYDEFVARRMGSIFGYQNFLKLRMQDLEVMHRQVNREYAQLKMTLLTCEISVLIGRMDSRDRSLEKIQEFGENALVGVLIPYYFGMIAFHKLIGDPNTPLYAWPLLITVCVAAILIFRFLRFRGEAEEPSLLPRMWSSSAILLVYVAAIWIFYLLADELPQPGTPTSVTAQGPENGH